MHTHTHACKRTHTCTQQVADMKKVNSECLDKGDYGFTEGQPCVVIKMNKVFEFIPKLKKDSKEKFLEIECRGKVSLIGTLYPSVRLIACPPLHPLPFWPFVCLFIYPFVCTKKSDKSRNSFNAIKFQIP